MYKYVYIYIYKYLQMVYMVSPNVLFPQLSLEFQLFLDGTPCVWSVASAKHFASLKNPPSSWLLLDAYHLVLIQVVCAPMKHSP